MQTNNRTPERYLAKPVHQVFYPPVWALYSPDKRQVVALVGASDLLNSPRMQHAEACGPTELL